MNGKAENTLADWREQKEHLSKEKEKEESLMQMQGRRLEVIFPSDTDNDLVGDFIAVITSMASCICGRRTSKQRAEKIKQCVEHAIQEDK